MARRKPRIKLEARKKGYAVVERGRVLCRVENRSEYLCFLDGYLGKPAGFHKEQERIVEESWRRYHATGSFLAPESR